MKTLLALYQRYPITTIFIVTSVLISTITWFGYVDSTLLWFVFDRDLILSGQIWRAITPIFLHFPAFGIIFAHLAFNMIWLYFFGIRIEKLDSSRFLLLLIMLSGLLSNIAQSLVSLGIFGGMSGVVYALLGYVFIRGKFDKTYPQTVPDNMAYFLIGFMLLSITGLLGSNIANTAHVVGFVVGGLFAVAMLKHHH